MSEKDVHYNYRFRRDSADNWAAVNPVLAEGELGIDTTNDVTKIGDGVSNWQSLGKLVRIEPVEDDRPKHVHEDDMHFDFNFGDKVIGVWLVSSRLSENARLSVLNKLGGLFKGNRPRHFYTLDYCRPAASQIRTYYREGSTSRYPDLEILIVHGVPF